MHDEYYKRGLEKATQKDYLGAIEEFNCLLQQNPYLAQAYYQRGLAYYDYGKILQAVSDFTEALKLNPEYVEAYYSRGLARLALKNLPGALSDVEQAIRFNSNYAAAYRLQGIVSRKQGYTQKAIASFKQAAELYLQQKDLENCRQCLLGVEQLQPKKQAPVVTSNTQPVLVIKSAGDYYAQILEKAEQGNTKEAIEGLNWALQVDPQDAKAYCCRGVVRCKMGSYQDAIADFNQALRLNYQDAIVYRNRGKARSYLGDNQGAIADFNQALQIQPEDALLYVARGNTYKNMGNYYGAIKDYTQALVINPQDAQAYYCRGMAYTCLEEMQRAVDDYQQAASIFCQQEDWDNYKQVLDSLKKIHSPTPEKKENTDNQLRQRLLRMVGGHWEIAQRLIEQAKNYYPGMAEHWYMEKVIQDLERDRG